MRTNVFLGLGSNVGERIFYINEAIKELNSLEETEVIKCSSIYETEPWGNKNQNDFLNCVVEIKTNLKPEDLVKELKGIEKKIGRVNRTKWSEREIDIDILFYDDLIFENETLVIPHPEIDNRKFVLIPLNEIASEFINPVTKKTIRQSLEETKDKLEVKKYSSQNISAN